MADVPRDARGWPTVPPTHFTLPQLIQEARSWRGDYPSGTVGDVCWRKYTDELVRRGFSTRTEIQERVLPDEVQRHGERPRWYNQLEDHSG